MADENDHSEETSEFAEGPAGEARPKSVSLLERIKQTLTGTAPDRWDQAGDELDSSKKYQKPQETWEQIYCTDVKSGVLVLRCSTPVRSKYFGGGYSLEECGVPVFTVEVRPRGWAPKMLIDPYFRTTSGIERKLEKLAEGDVARQLYDEIATSVRDFRMEIKREFDLSVERFMAEYIDRVHQTSAEDWEVHATDRHVVKYSADVDNLLITIVRTISENAAYYNLNFSRSGLSWDCRDSTAMKEIFAIVDESVRQSSLEKLGKVLEDMF